MNDNLKKRPFGFTDAWNGLKEVVKAERNFKIHVVAALLVVITGFIVQLSMIKWAIILLTIGLVLIAEVVNTAVEEMLDYLKPDINQHARIIKDISAGAVFIAAVIAAIVGLLIILPELYDVFW